MGQQSAQQTQFRFLALTWIYICQNSVAAPVDMTAVADTEGAVDPPLNHQRDCRASCTCWRSTEGAGQDIAADLTQGSHDEVK